MSSTQARETGTMLGVVGVILLVVESTRNIEKIDDSPVSPQAALATSAARDYNILTT